MTRALRYAIPGLILVGFAAQIVLRTTVSGAVEIDEGEQLILTQSLRLGYGSQPPLYQWLQTFAFWLLGVNIFALTLTKHLILILTYVFSYATTRAITGDEKTALAAVLTILVLPQLSLESHRTLTHSVLAVSAAAATLWAFVRATQRAKVLDYAWFGLAGAVGVLSKYNFLIFLAGLLVAALSLERFRRPLTSPMVLVSVAVMLALLSPHLNPLKVKRVQRKVVRKSLNDPR